MTRRNTIVCGFGRKGSGKSQLLWDWYTSRAPRVISLFSQPEDKERYSNAIEAVGWRRFLEVLELAAGYGRWHIDAVLEPEDVRELFTMLAPPYGDGDSLALAFGGLAVETGELHMLAPNGSTPKEILSAVLRSRHYALDFYLATQRPASVAIDLRSQADVVFSFALESPRDMTAAASELRLANESPLLALGRYQCLYRTRDDGRTVQLDAERRVMAELNPQVA